MEAKEGGGIRFRATQAALVKATAEAEEGVEEGALTHSHAGLYQQHHHHHNHHHNTGSGGTTSTSSTRSSSISGSGSTEESEFDKMHRIDDFGGGDPCPEATEGTSNAPQGEEGGAGSSSPVRKPCSAPHKAHGKPYVCPLCAAEHHMGSSNTKIAGSLTLPDGSRAWLGDKVRKRILRERKKRGGERGKNGGEERRRKSILRAERRLQRNKFEGCIPTVVLVVWFIASFEILLYLCDCTNPFPFVLLNPPAFACV